MILNNVSETTKQLFLNNNMYRLIISICILQTNKKVMLCTGTFFNQYNGYVSFIQSTSVHFRLCALISARKLKFMHKFGLVSQNQITISASQQFLPLWCLIKGRNGKWLNNSAARHKYQSLFVSTKIFNFN